LERTGVCGRQREGKLDEAAEIFQRRQGEYTSGNDADRGCDGDCESRKLFEAQGRPDLAALAWADALRRFEALGEPVAIAHALLGQGPRTSSPANKDLPKADMHLRRAARNFRHLQLYDEAAEAGRNAATVARWTVTARPASIGPMKTASLIALGVTLACLHFAGWRSGKRSSTGHRSRLGGGHKQDMAHQGWRVSWRFAGGREGSRKMKFVRHDRVVYKFRAAY
jgi:hypothetical protein